MDSQIKTPDHIRTKPVVNCLVCHSPGKPLYQNLSDGITKVSGQWNLKQCSNSACSTIWLDPEPIEEDLIKLYQNYVTHQTIDKDNFFIECLRTIVRTIRNFNPDRANLDALYLNHLKPGRVLDIGCGDGQRLALLSKKGWETYGQEFDPNAAAFSLGNDSKIYLGELKSLQLPENIFDAVIMNHVIEHLTDPMDILKECLRILKKGGHLVIVTPNTKALTHSFFKKHWIGLDPPRHITIFSIESLHDIGRQAGFSECRTWTTFVNSYGFIRWSFLISQQKGHEYLHIQLLVCVKAVILSSLFDILSILNYKNRGDESVLFATK